MTPEQISSLVSMSADRAWRKGDKGRANFEKSSRWVVKSTLPLTARPEEHIKNLSECLSPLVDNIRELAKENDVSFWCAMSIYPMEEYNPGLYFARETVELLSSLSASLNIDLYYLVGADENV